uniref:RNA polymerase sigma factor 70 region 4 type 2 domain-containing protein n=1 Tax=Eiseniibacteriota bacterium TaxID=2212470 RepID=A0A832I0F7_UNCEI
MQAAVRRPRGLKRAPAPVQRVAALCAARERVSAALARFREDERAVLALLLVERLTPGEAARALDVPVAALMRGHRALLAELRRALRGTAPRPSRRGESRARIVPLARAGRP